MHLMILTAVMIQVAPILAIGVFASWLMGAFEMTLEVLHRLPDDKIFQAHLRVFCHRRVFAISPRSLAFLKWAVVLRGHNMDDRLFSAQSMLLSF